MYKFTVKELSLVFNSFGITHKGTIKALVNLCRDRSKPTLSAIIRQMFKGIGTS